MLLTQAAQEYVAHVRASGLRESTARDREQALRAFIRTTGDIHAARVTALHIDKFFATNSRWAAGTRNNRLGILRMFFKWCRFRRYMALDSDPLYGWGYLDYLPNEKIRIPRQQWPVLFQHCESELETITLAVGLYTMMRGSEIRRVKLKDVHLNDARPVIIKTITKGKSRRVQVPISAELEPYVRAHLTWMFSQGFTNPEHYFIPTYFPPLNKPGGQFVRGRKVVNPDRPICRPYDTVKTILARAGYVTKGEGVHTLRRSGARALYEAGLASGYSAALLRAQTMLGHAKSEMTERYIGVSLNEELVLQEFAGKPMYPVVEGQDAKIIPIRGEM